MKIGENVSKADYFWLFKKINLEDSQHIQKVSVKRSSFFSVHIFSNSICLRGRAKFTEYVHHGVCKFGSPFLKGEGAGLKP